MKVTVFATSYKEWQAHCQDCEWSDHTMTAKRKARYHSSKTGHNADAYGERHFAIRAGE